MSFSFARPTFTTAASGRGAVYVEDSTDVLIGGRSEKRINTQIRQNLAGTLRPGDVLITRHDLVLTNLFLPGYWPHAALYIGTSEQRDELGIEINADKISPQNKG